jgi:chaperone required for assembly of F1-ATPase
MKRFYKTVAADETPEGFRILLDGRPVQTPGRSTLLLPTSSLAEAVAEEWRAQGDEVDPVSMPLLRLANTVLDGVRANRAEVIATVLRFGEHDLLCYRAEAPAALVGRQKAEWNPMLAWAAENYGAHLTVTNGIGHVAQPHHALAALERVVAAQDDFALAGLHVIASITGSLVLALALVAGAINPAQAFQLSRLDELYQAESWGTDAEAQKRVQRLGREIDVATAFSQMSRV